MTYYIIDILINEYQCKGLIVYYEFRDSKNKDEYKSD